MASPVYFEQEHGYRSGHQLLKATIRLERTDQDVVDRLSDMAGSLRPGETFAPYLTTYPVPSSQYYVLGRTWQDLAAPRAGCVLTRSIIVPMAEWETSQNLLPYFQMLQPVGDNESDDRPFVNAFRDPVADPRMTELVEALFLEARLPTLVFDCQDADAICIRLLNALWPRMRRSFSICTFALAPRRIEGRDFDLQFSPAGARTRFADWSGRKIEPSGRSQARHRWSSAMAYSIFQTEAPSFASKDLLGALNEDESGDGSALRLSLLWGELIAKAESDPGATLGLLDIANSRPSRRFGLIRSLNTVLSNALRRVASDFPIADAWSFLLSYAAKFANGGLTLTLASHLMASAKRISQRNPEEAIHQLSKAVLDLRKPFQLISRGAELGLATDADEDIYEQLLLETPIEAHVRLLMGAKPFSLKAAAVAGSRRSVSETIWPALLEPMQPVERSQFRRRFLPHIIHAHQLPFLNASLVDARLDDLITATDYIGANTDFKDRVLNDALVARALELHNNQWDWRTHVVQRFKGTSSDAFLLSHLKFNQTGLDWLTSVSLPNERRSALLISYLRQANDVELRAIQSSSPSFNMLLSTLIDCVPGSSDQILRIANSEILGFEGLKRLTQEAIEDAAPDFRSSVMRPFVQRALLEAAVNDSFANEAIVENFGNIPHNDLIELLANRRASTSRVAKNLSLTEYSPHSQKQLISTSIDKLSQQLVSRPFENLGLETYKIWANLITLSGARDIAVQFRAASITLTFAMKAVSLPVSELVKTAFPIIYRHLPKNRDDDLFSLGMELLTMALPVEVNWDRAKAAERELVYAFMDSNWPAIDLFSTASACGVEKKVLKRVYNRYGGEKYLREINKSAGTLPTLERAKLSAAISNFRF